MNETIKTRILLLISLLFFISGAFPVFSGMIDANEIDMIKRKVSFGKAIYSETEFDAAIAEFEKITHLEPENLKAKEVLKMLRNQAALKRKTNELFHAGQRSAIQGEWLDATEFFQKALKIEPKNESIKTAYLYARERLVGAKKFSMDFEDESLKDILLALGQESGTNIIVPQQMTSKVSVHFSDVTLEEALENILKGSDYDVEMSNDFIRIVPKQKKILVDLFSRDEKIVNQKWDNIEVQDLIEVLAQMMNVNIIFDPEIKDKGKEKISLFIKEMSLWDTFNLLLKMKKLVAKKYNNLENTLIIMDPESIVDSEYDRDRRVHKKIDLTNIKPSVYMEIAKKIKGISDRVNLDNVVVLDKKETGLDGETRMNGLLVYDVPENIDLLEALAKKIDIKRRQCVISVKLLEISSQLSKKLGFNVDFNPTGADDTSLDRTVDAKFFENFKAQLVSVGSARVMTDKLLLSATLDFLDQHNMTKTIASPSVTAMDGEEASINITTTKPVQFAKVNTATNSQGDSVMEVTYDWKDLNYGVKLNVKPIVHDDDEISLSLNLDKDSPGSRVDGRDQTFRYESSTNNIDTILRIKNGHTVIMGGLISKQRTVNKTKIPFLSDIPLLGKLFEQNNVDDPENKELIIFVTPKIVNETAIAAENVIEPDLLKDAKKDDHNDIVEKIRKRLKNWN